MSRQASSFGPGKSRTLSGALDDFSTDKQPRRRKSSSAPTLLIVLTGLGLLGTLGAAVLLVARFQGVLRAPRSVDSEDANVAYLSLEEIQANAAKQAEATGSQVKRPPLIRLDIPRVNAKGGSDTRDGITARVVSVRVDRNWELRRMVSTTSLALLRVDVGFQLASLGQTRKYGFDPDMMPVARVADESGKIYPQLEIGHKGRFGGTLRFDKQDIQSYYFDSPDKTRLLYIDFFHPSSGRKETFNFYIPAEMYNVNR